MVLKSNIHTHSNFVDGRDAPEDMVRAALALGFHTLGFSEHGHADYDDCSMTPAQEPAYRAEVLRLREKYRGRLNILLGYEHDWFAPFDPAPYDYIIESVHYLPVPGGYVCVDNTRAILEAAVREHFGGDPYALCRAYFDAVCRSIEGTGAAVLGHIELVMKFNERRDLFDDADPRYLGPALATAELAARSGRLVEVNTGAIARGYRREPYPGRAMLEHIRACGGRVIVTSDCHDAAFLDCAFPETLALLRACGFRTVWMYDGPEAVERALPQNLS